MSAFAADAPSFGNWHQPVLAGNIVPGVQERSEHAERSERAEHGVLENPRNYSPDHLGQLRLDPSQRPTAPTVTGVVAAATAPHYHFSEPNL